VSGTTAITSATTIPSQMNSFFLERFGRSAMS
jgi:hypothetical protein